MPDVPPALMQPTGDLIMLKESRTLETQLDTIMLNNRKALQWKLQVDSFQSWVRENQKQVN